MRSKSENNKQKRLARKKQKAKSRQRRTQKKQASFREKHQYPKFEYNTSNSNEEFVELIRGIVDSLDFEDSSLFSSEHRKLLRILADQGVVNLENHLLKESEGVSRTMITNDFCLHIGKIIFENIPARDQSALLPINDVRVIPVGNCFRLIFSKLETVSIKGHALYYSRHEPKVNIDGKKRTVVYTWHMMERTRERLNPRWEQYAAAGDVHAWFSHCLHFEPCYLEDNQEAVTFYDIAIPGFKSFQIYVLGVLNRNEIDLSKGFFYYRAGYCPVVIEGEYAIAKTFLYPGFKSTPEFKLIEKSDLPRSEKTRLSNLSRENNASNVIVNEDIELIKWFHNNGVPQVIQTNRKMFDYQ